MSVRKKLLEEINAKAKRIQDMRERANDSSAERDVFEFFRHADEAKLISGSKTYDMDMIVSAFESLLRKLKRFDYYAHARIEWVDGSTREESQIRGVTIIWSDAYASKMCIEAQVYIDVGQMIFA
jgi:hypothetical protein